MLIEYKIKFEKDGLTIAQRIEPNSTKTQRIGVITEVPAALPAGTRTLSAIAPVDPSGDPLGPTDSSTGPPPSSSAPIFILGPIVFGGAPPAQALPQAPQAEPNAPGPK